MPDDTRPALPPTDGPAPHTLPAAGSPPTADLDPAATVPTAGPAGTPPGELLAGRYALREPLGEGGMGTVYRAEQLHPVRRPVAVKLIRDGRETAGVLRRFAAERQALARMAHPHIAKVFDAGAAADGRPFVAMELVDGPPLTDFCDRHALDRRARLVLFRQVCEAVTHAHQRGVIHRDLKPSNILVGADGPKVIDFGLAKAFVGRLTDETFHTGAGSLLGTPAYMAPEQAWADPDDVDTRADVFALGAVLYELLTGGPPLTRDDLKGLALDELVAKVRAADIPPPSKRVKGLPRDLDWIALKALAKDRDRRYGSPADLSEDVRRHLADEPVAARRPTVGYRLRKFARRHRAGIVVCGAILAAGGTAGGGSWHSRRAAARAAIAEINELGYKEMLREVQAQDTHTAAAAALGTVDVLFDPAAARGLNATSPNAEPEYPTLDPYTAARLRPAYSRYLLAARGDGLPALPLKDDLRISLMREALLRWRFAAVALHAADPGRGIPHLERACAINEFLATGPLQVSSPESAELYARNRHALDAEARHLHDGFRSPLLRTDPRRTVCFYSCVLLADLCDRAGRPQAARDAIALAERQAAGEAAMPAGMCDALDGVRGAVAAAERRFADAERLLLRRHGQLTGYDGQLAAARRAVAALWDGQTLDLPERLLLTPLLTLEAVADAAGRPPEHGQLPEELTATVARLVDLYRRWERPGRVTHWRAQLPRELAPPPRPAG